MFSKWLALTLRCVKSPHDTRRRAYLEGIISGGWTIEEIAKEMNRTPGSIVGQIYDLGEAGKLSFDMWGKKAKDKPKAEGPFRLFVLKDDNEPAGQATSPVKAV